MHTEKIWNEQIKRTRKEAFKFSRQIVDLQEALRAAKVNQKAAEAEYNSERDRLREREQEAFAARYQLVGVQEELAKMTEMVKLVEQERDALRTIAKNEEIARIAAEGRLPLPESKEDDEFTSPRRNSRQLAPVTIQSSAASEEEIESLKFDLLIERKRAERALDQVEFMEMECCYNRCNCKLADLREEVNETTVKILAEADTKSVINTLKDEDKDFDLYSIAPHQEAREAVFIPEEGIFRVTDQEVPESSPWISPAKAHGPHTETLSDAINHQLEASTSTAFGRTPSCDPPSFARIPDTNTSLLSLVEATEACGIHTDDHSNTSRPIETTTPQDHSNVVSTASVIIPKSQAVTPAVLPKVASPSDILLQSASLPEQEGPKQHFGEQPDKDRGDSHVVSSSQPIRTFHTISTTTRIPLSDPDATPKVPHHFIAHAQLQSSLASSIHPGADYHHRINQDVSTLHPAGPRPAPKSLSQPDLIHSAQAATFDATNAAFSPTMTREEALAMIQERRGRARSLAQPTMTPRKQMVTGAGERRDISAPAVRTLPRSVSRGRMGRT